MNQKIILSITLLISVIFISSCRNSKGKNIPDVSNIKVHVDVKDFNQALFSIDTNDIRNGIVQLQQAFPPFFDLYFTTIVPIRQQRDLDESFFQTVQGFLTDPDIRKLADTTAIVYPNLEKYEKEFEQAFQFYKYHFPENSIPKIYPFISGFNYAAFIFPITPTEDGLGVGLDMFLGKDYPYWQLGIQNPAFSQYITRTFTPEHLVKKTIDALVDGLIDLPKGDRLLDLMIYNGKKMYLLDQILPYTSDSIKWEYTAAQTDWVINNEVQLWSHLLKEELLYETSTNKIKKLVDQSPSSPGMPQEAPGRTANYIGFRIIEAFIKRKPEVTVEQLISLDAQKILDQAKFKPRIPN